MFCCVNGVEDSKQFLFLSSLGYLCPNSHPVSSFFSHGKIGNHENLSFSLRKEKEKQFCLAVWKHEENSLIGSSSR